MDETGRPEYSEEQYQKWFDDLTPFFKLGETLNEAIDDAGLIQHRTTLYRKSSLKDWFWHKMTTYQQYPGKIANKVLAKRMILIEEKLKQDLPITRDDMDDVKFVAEKHRSSITHFVNRVENSPAKSLDDVVVELNHQDEMVDNVADEAVKALEKEQNNVTPPGSTG